MKSNIILKFLIGFPLVIFLVFGRNSIPWEMIGVNNGRVIIITSLVMSIGFLIILNNMLLGNDTFFYSGTLAAIVLFVAMLLFFFLFTNSQEYSLYKLQTILLWVVVPSLVLSFSWKSADINYYLFSIILIGVFTSVNLFINSEVSFSGRVVYDGYNPIWIARMLGVSSLACLIYISYKDTKRKYIYFILTLIFFSFMLFTGSKGPLISLILSIIIYFLLVRRSVNVKRLFLIMIFTISCIYIMLFILPENNGLDRFTEFSIQDASFQGRIYYITLGIEAFFDSPILGQGLGGFPIYAFNIDERIYPHNFLVEVMAEFGLVGILFFLSMVIVFVCTVRKIRYSKLKYKDLLMAFPSIFIFYLINSFLSGDLAGNLELIICFFILVTIYLEMELMSKKRGNVSS